MIIGALIVIIAAKATAVKGRVESTGSHGKSYLDIAGERLVKAIDSPKVMIDVMMPVASDMSNNRLSQIVSNMLVRPIEPTSAAKAGNDQKLATTVDAHKRR